MKEILPIQKRLWAEIDLDAVAHNFYEARRALRKGVKICCVIKANAYGHGACELGRVYEELGADMLAVSNLEEAIELRDGGIALPILVLGYSPAECAEIMAKNRIEQAVYSLEYAKELSRYAKAAGVTVRAHIKLDTGMGRIGFLCRGGEKFLAEAYEACRLDGIIPVGIFTHFAVADGGACGDEFTREQAEAFLHAVAYLEKRGISFETRHIANSAAIFDYPEYAFDMVRAGISLYGEPPSRALRANPELKCTMTLCSVVSNVKTVNPGESVGYGRTFVAERTMRVATVPIGYADGFFRRASGGAVSLAVNGRLAPTLGRVCMDQVMIDVTDIEDVKSGTPVTVFGDGAMSAGEMAAALDTISYEIFTDVARRVPRVYLRGGKPISVCDYLLEK